MILFTSNTYINSCTLTKKYNRLKHCKDLIKCVNISVIVITELGLTLNKTVHKCTLSAYAYYKVFISVFFISA